MAKKGSTQTTTTSPDAFTDEARRRVWESALAVNRQPYEAFGGQRVAGPNALTTENLGRANSMLGEYAGWQGPQVGDVNSYMNPYDQSVISGVQGDYDRIRDQSMMQTDEMATKAGAFGGSRHGVASGIALGDVGRAEANTLAGIRQGGFDRAAMLRQQDYGNQMGLMDQRLGSVGQMANLGLSGGGYLRNVDQQGLDAQYGQFLEGRDWNRNNLGMMSGVLGGLPGGSTSETHTPGSGLAGWVGAGLGIGSMFLPGGGLAGLIGGGAAAQSGYNPSFFSEEWL